MSRSANRLTLVDLFAGCGGLSLGLEMAGFEPVFVNELHRDALETYLVNRPHLSLDRRGSHCSDIRELTRSSGELDALSNRLRRNFGDISLVVGGPPCQGFSGRGIRSTFSSVERYEIPSNYLYREMARVISSIGPRMFLFENVSGLIRARWTRDGTPGEIWEDVLRAFRRVRVRSRGKILQYRLESKVVRSRDFGVPQNRPRLLLVGIREDVKNSSDVSLIPMSSVSAPDLVDLLDDLVDPKMQNGGVTNTYPSRILNDVQRAFRTGPNGHVLRKGEAVSDHEYTFHSEVVLRRYRAMLRNGGRIPASLVTKKFAQRLLPSRWPAAGPSITATSCPDDYVHYSQPRILTVREWARLQTFPDHYQFCGKRTTGGRRRAGDPSLGIWDRELPKYTQIGNAVPVRLAEALGLHFKGILRQ